MRKIMLVIIFVFTFVIFTSGLIYAEHKCTESVTCSDGTEIKDVSCSSSYEVIKGHRVDNDSEDTPGSNDTDDSANDHHQGNYEDPCHFGHGHRVDNDSVDTNGSVEGNVVVNQDEIPPEDPYHLKGAKQRDYDPNDPYGLRQGGQGQ